MEHNPWLSIWCKPRATIAKIVHENPNRSLWTLAAIYGFCSLLNLFQSMALGTSLSTAWIFGLAIVLAPFWGYINFAIWSWVVTWVGRWFKGHGKFTEVRSAYAWSSVPLIINIPLWLLMVALFGHQLFVAVPNSNALPDSQIILILAVSIVKIILTVWSIVIYLNALAQVQHYSILRAIFNVIIAGLIIAVVSFLIWTLLIYTFSGSAPTAAMVLQLL